VDTFPESGKDFFIKTTQDRLRQVETGRQVKKDNKEGSRQVQTGPDRSRQVQTGPDRSRQVQTGPDRSRQVQTGPDKLKSDYFLYRNLVLSWEKKKLQNPTMNLRIG
jgi:hypothetical protein